MNFPRYIFAVGGAGKNLLYMTLEKEWILREIIKPQFSPTAIDITIIDTAIDEENEDRERIEKIENHIKILEDEYRSNIDSEGSEGRIIGKIGISYMLLTKDMILQSPYDLIGIGKEVKRATGADVWWINDPEKLGEDWQKRVINRENFKELNFTKGVYRKRAIGKAIYYKAVSEGKFDIDLLQTAQVDILVGLGGGTGSGMAFDLAKKFKSIQPTADITLFGILSTLDESPDEKANNYAMISEIEYGYLNRDTPFKDIIFIPMEVTRYPGRERASDEHERLLKEFDETIPYILMAYHNNPAQLVGYNVASIKRLKDKLIDAFNNKDSSLKDEEDIYIAIKKFIDEFYADIIKSGQLPDEDKTFIKDDRFSKFNTILGHKFFVELDYNSVKYLKRAVDAGIAGATGTTTEDIGKQISSIKGEVETISIGEDGYKEDADLRLHKILKKDIEKNNQEWQQNERKNIELLESIDDKVPVLINDFTDLKNKLKEFSLRINSLNNIKNIEVEPIFGIEDAVNKISQELEKIGMYYDDRNIMVKNLINIKELKKAHIESKKRLPIVDKILGIVVKTDRIKKQKESTNKVLLKSTELNSDKIFEATINHGLSVSSVYQYNIEQKIENRKLDIIDGIIKRTSEIFQNADPKFFSALKGLLLI